MRNYRIVCSTFLTIFGFIMGFLILSVQVGQVNVWFLVCLAVLVCVVSGYFCSVNGSGGEGLQVCFMV